MSENPEIGTVLTGHELQDERGEKIGVVDDVIFDLETQKPAWAVVKLGMLHPRPTAVPLNAGYLSSDGAVVVPYDKRIVAAAPKVGRDHVLTPDVEHALRVHYHT